ncbi:Shikimate kinase I |uniref:Shikimate kinase n=1 Tax=Micrococcus lylae TaxID=1273 RepID=A0A1R4IA60_9MICC|nr:MULTISPECIES: shikimate kinase [Micrococcus]MCT2006491.1 shikimate kinase [Micrococcus lylae]MCT2070968.1 shikimate kinase [Micrococcus lylae]WIK82984.1 shikimate kinase [Micrococcus lylae]SJN16688.1 Shikimate kinase I \
MSPTTPGGQAWRRTVQAVERELERLRVPSAWLWRWRLRRRIVLVGPMGCGKSTVGRELARLVGCAHLDADAVFTQAHGPIPEFFVEHGEPAFRRAEEQVMEHLLSRHRPFVLSCGGGAVLSAATRRRLKESDDHVVHLDVAPSDALRRVRGGHGRPALKGDPKGNWERLRNERDHLYREVADVTIDTTGLSSQDVAWRIVESVRRRNKE